MYCIQYNYYIIYIYIICTCLEVQCEPIIDVMENGWFSVDAITPLAWRYPVFIKQPMRKTHLAFPISALRWFRVRVWSHVKHFRISMPPKWMVTGDEMVWIGYPKTTNPFKLQEFLRRLRILSDDGITFLSQMVTWWDFEKRRVASVLLQL